MSADEKPSSSDAIIASLISEVRKTNTPFNVNELIGGSFKEDDKNKDRKIKCSIRSDSLHRHSKKSKRKKEKKSKKSRKLKHHSRSRSSSPKIRKRHRSSSSSKKFREIREKQNYVITPSVEAVMEKISDEEDELPVGSDYLSISASTSAMQKISETPGISNDIIKKRESRSMEEVFPLSKKSKKTEPPRPKKVRPLSEILAKVRAERDNLLLPRNIKLKQERSSSQSADPNHAVNASKREEGSIEYGPQAPELKLQPPLIISGSDGHTLTLNNSHSKKVKVINGGSDENIRANASNDGATQLNDLSAPSSLENSLKTSKKSDGQKFPNHLKDCLQENDKNNVHKEGKRKSEKKRRSRSNSSSSSANERKTSDKKYPKNDSVHVSRSRRDAHSTHMQHKIRQKIWRSTRDKRSASIVRRSHSYSPSPSNSISRSRSRSRSQCSRSLKDRKSKHHRQKDIGKGSDKKLKIDKKKLLEIARKNVAQMAQQGFLPSVTDVKNQRKAVGPSVDQLVDFCQRLQRSQSKEDRLEKGENVSSDDDYLAPKKRESAEEVEFVKHPFSLKPAAPITINISNSIMLPVKTPAQRTAEESQLRLCFPVSSGAQHREKDNEWTPVEKARTDNSIDQTRKPNVTGQQSTRDRHKGKNTEKQAGNSFVLPPPPPPPMLASSALMPSLPPPPPPPVFNELQATVAQFGVQSKHQFSPSHTPANIGMVLATKIEANRRISINKSDLEAQCMLREANEQMREWAENKTQAGMFTGSTGVNVLRAEQLGPNDPRYSAWAKKDLFKQANAINGGVGLRLMQKMGWTPGEGLGKARDGPLEPLALDIKSDRKGLTTVEETSKKLRTCILTELSGKHPVSMLMELCSKKKWPAPQFSCDESGPSNNRRFVWKAVVNGVAYQSLVSSNNKKAGKAQVCKIVLQSLGLMPPDTNMPI